MTFDKINAIEKKHAISNIAQVNNLSKIDTVEMDLLRQKAILQDKAANSGHWYYYAQLLDLQDSIRCHNEILEKYPYDGKSTFKELLIKKIDKNNI